MMIPENWGELLEPTLHHLFSQHHKKLPDYLREFYNVETSRKAVETTLGIGSIGEMDEWVASGSQVSYEDINKGYSQTYTHKKHSKGIQIQRELLEDDLFNEIRKRVRELSHSVYITYQKQAASTFNNAFNAGYPGPDSVALCSAAHPYSPSDATTQSNTSTDVLNSTSLETARTAMLGWTDDKDNILALNPDLLIVPTALRKTALVIADSSGEPDVSDNNINVWHGAVTVVEYRFLTSTTAWFLSDSMRMKVFLNWLNRRVPVLQREKETFDSEISKFKTVGRWAKGWDSWDWVRGSNGAG